MNSVLGTSECVQLGRKVMSGVEGGRVGAGWIKHCIHLLDTEIIKIEKSQ